jgi:hypothetical protein
LLNGGATNSLIDGHPIFATVGRSKNGPRGSGVDNWRTLPVGHNNPNATALWTTDETPGGSLGLAYTEVAASVTGSTVPVVTLLSCCHNVIATPGLSAVRVAPIAVGQVAVVALLATSDDTIAATRRCTVGVAAVAIDQCPVVT